MKKLRDSLPNGNISCHIYTDDDNITTIHNTMTNETYRIIPDISTHGFHLERHKDGKLVARNSFGFYELKILADLSGSNFLLENLRNKGGEQN